MNADEDFPARSPMWPYGMHWWLTGQIIALVCGVLVGIDFGFAVGVAVASVVMVLVNFRQVVQSSRVEASDKC